MNSTVVRLSLMMFLQFFVWGAWFSTINQALGSHGLSDFVGATYGTVPLGAIFAPLFLGIIADRFFPSQIVMGVLFLIGGVLMFSADRAANDGNGPLMVNLFLGHMLCYMPTLGLGNTIAFSHLDRIQFPKIRVWGTIGWIVAGLFIGFLGWSSNLGIMKVAAISSVLLGVYSFFLPHTPAPAKGQKINLRALLMLDAWKLLTKPAFLVFIVCSGLICIPLAYYFGTTGYYLSNAGFEEAASTMTIGQMSEIIFMLLIPFFFRKLGVKWMIIIGMLAWIARYLLFAFGAPDQAVWMLFLGIALHGICYDFFFVTGFMYTDRVAPKKIRSQAQSMLVFITQGIGMYIGYGIAFGFSIFSLGISIFGWQVYDGNKDFEIFGWKPAEGQFNKVEGYGPLNEAMKKAREGEKEAAYSEKLGKMFSVDMPEKVDQSLVDTAMGQWKTFWMFPAIMAAIVLVIFFLAFWDKTKVGSDDDDS